MIDLYASTDHRLLLKRWDYLFALLEIVARDYRAVLTAGGPPQLHRDILLQTAADLRAVGAALDRLAVECPADRLSADRRALWAAGTAWAGQNMGWVVPPDDLPAAAVRDAQSARRATEGEFRDAVLALGGADADVPALVSAADDRLG